MSQGERLLDAIQSLSAEASASLQERLSASVGVEPRTAAILMLMWRDGRPMQISFRDIEQALQLSQSSASRAAASLAGSGLVTFTSDPADARFKRVELTRQGQVLARQVAAARAAAVDDLSGMERILDIAREGSSGTASGLAAETVGDRRVVAFGESLLRVSAEPVLVADVLYVRDALEPAMLDEATRLRTDIDVAECRGIIGLMRDSLEDAPRFYRADWALHRRMVQICKNEVLKSMYLALLSALENRLEEVLPTDNLRDYLGRRLVIHEELVEALASGDTARMARAAQGHHFLALTRDAGAMRNRG
ncbi:FadR/GntR family transcriptional regulator [Prescottella subtropica]|uniref:FadR/GntR family transcriptional regulator n=1 Tax=Prescottella subtropica TaxID=2545757 RepID=UPI001386C056|nr:FCD domain-containing protein [Prescottella subtropica]